MIRFGQLQASYNARRRGPVHKLPVEILTQIFANALAEEVDSPYLLQGLSQVCSQWRSIIADAALLYRSFRLENPMILTARHLERSRGLPLDVDIHDVKFNVSETVALMNSVSILSPQLDRVRSLSVTSHSSKMSAWVLGMLEDFPDRRLTSLSLALTRQEKPVSLGLPDSEETAQTFRGLGAASFAPNQMTSRRTFGAYFCCSFVAKHWSRECAGCGDLRRLVKRQPLEACNVPLR